MAKNFRSHDSARVVRLLSMLARRPASIGPARDSAVMVLLFDGLKSVKCPRAIISKWQTDGLVTVSGDGISITTSGKAFVKRHGNAPEAQPAASRFAAQHVDMVDKPGAVGAGGEAFRVNANESPIGRMLQLKDAKGQRWITDIEFEAGDRLRRDFEFAQLAPRMTQSFDPDRIARSGRNGANRAAEISDGAISARDRVNAALEALGPELGGLAVDACCFLKGLEQIEMERSWPRRSAKVVLKTALAMLSRHYFPTARGRQRSSGIRTWASPGYSPPINPGG